ncbi:hypothetical protein KPL71_024285 [Citrus sinensis]|uniref:Uncharacterized protein n=1 Tax=Citrus sinensis TaxID=2711 RepID=A0ACB8IRD2_CITSI|nr:hypothetical protein KPL71_024285 [Citrus sinensis]
MPCDYALLADETFNIAEFQASKDKSSSNVTIEWVVEEKNCPDNPNSKVDGCGDNTNCYYSENGKGYRCKCKQGFQGNPYLGCVDIDECLDKEKYHCEGKCKNTIGSYTCDCPIGMYGDGKVDCRGFHITTIVGVIGAVIFSVIVGILIFIRCIERRKQKNFLKNGGEILKHQSVRIFSAAELVKATENFNESHFLGEGGFGSVYKAKVADFGASVLISPDQAAMATKVQGTFGYLDPEYLMTGNLIEKSDVYSFGVVLVELLTGVKPGSHMTLASNENINIVHYFLSSIENNDLRQILTFRVADESEMEEVEIVAELASECLRSSGVKRPTMKRVSEELDRLKRLLKIYGHRRTVKRQSIC